MTDASTQESNKNSNEIPADSSSLQIQPIANSLVPKMFHGLNERHILILWQTSYYKKVFVYTAMYDDESDEKESDRDAGAHQTSNSDIGA